MALTKTNIGTGPDGRPLWHYVQTDPDKPVVITGGATGEVTTSDGATYNVTEPVIEVDSEAHAGEVAHAIGVQFEDQGHPDHSDGEPFAHDCTEACGALSRTKKTRKG